jgi:hypothetical protein
VFDPWVHISARMHNPLLSEKWSHNQTFVTEPPKSRAVCDGGLIPRGLISAKCTDVCRLMNTLCGRNQWLAGWRLDHVGFCTGGASASGGDFGVLSFEPEAHPPLAEVTFPAFWDPA